jgi:hypothetical protein
MDLLFGAREFTDESDRIVKEFFNSIYVQNRFLWAMELVVSKRGCSVNEEHCSFPDLLDADPSGHFEGVMFGGWFGGTIVTEARCRAYIDLTCRRYIELRPADAARVAEMLKGRLI